MTPSRSAMRALEPAPEELARAEPYSRMPAPFAHDMHPWHESSFVPEPAGAHIH